MTTPPNSAQPDSLGGTRMQPPPETLQVPLRFAGHNFETYCYNTVGCRVSYDNHNFSPWPGQQDPDSLISPAPDDLKTYRKSWGRSLYIGVRNFPAPAEVRWKSLDGRAHQAHVDIEAIFQDQLIWHKVPKNDMAHFFEGPYATDPNIFLEINNNAINVYIEALIPTKTAQIPGNMLSTARTDMFLVWTRTY